MALRNGRYDATIPALFWTAVLERAASVALCEKKFGVWQEISWARYGELFGYNADDKVLYLDTGQETTG